MREATSAEVKLLINYLGEYTTGILRKDLLKVRWSEIRVRIIVDNGWLNKSYVTRVTNIIVKTNALETISKSCYWY